MVSVHPLWGLIGALIAGPMAVQFGRKTSLLLNNLFVILSAVLVLASRACRSFEMIILSRVFAGVNAGLSMNVQPMYLGESAPKKLRGAVSMSSASFTALGIVLGQVIGLREILGSEWCWPLLLASNAIPGLVQLVTLPWLPESPRYLLIDKNNKEACLKALRRLRGSLDLSAEMDEMLEEQAAVKGERSKRPWELFQDRSVRWQLITVMVLSSAMQLCGNDSMYFYASYVFQEAGIPYDKIQYVVIGEDQPYMSMGCMFAYILSFGIGPAGVTGILPTEIFDQNSRPAAYMISGSLMWSMLFLVGMLFPFIVGGLGVFCYVPFCTVCVLSSVFIAFFLPETKGKSLLEISAEFDKRNSKGKEPRKAQYQLSKVCRSTALCVEPLKSEGNQGHAAGTGTLSARLQSWMLMVMVIILGLGGSFQCGFQISVMNAPSDHIQRFVNETWLKRYGTPMAESTIKLIWSIIVSIYSIGAVLGSISSGQLSVKYGRELLGGEEMWPYLLAFSGVPALLQLVGLFFFPDSPRYLFIDKGNEEGCVRERIGRKKLMGIGYALMATVLGILVLMLFLKALIGQFCFLIFMMYCVLAAAFTLLFVPETKGKTMLEIAEDFNKLNFKGRRSEVEGMQKEDFIIATKL
ncbi:Solute carrier family 2, facilitated glucose transporter member 11 [Acipenser ruthenus]|uniref:Solute carrier family 2, facilitated glucose transporter member 11 n=1 Tax=Acipenser ruthenus TaxID=7906 RepID=A0A444U5X5_ACIRT|nr:Solute carrier family 2, facilitated glucose transporter member 11 [Acipenser ruthenus]